MDINGYEHRYANLVQPRFVSAYPASENPIGIKVDADIVASKSESLKNYLQNFDMRSIKPSDIPKLAVTLHESGEISSSAAASLIIAASEMDDQSTPIDAVAHFESHWKRVDQLAKSDPTGFTESTRIYGDTLHTLYNLDDFIQGVRDQIGVNVYA